jgi:membrane-associated phospholipid phosphatase
MHEPIDNMACWRNHSLMTSSFILVLLLCAFFVHAQFNTNNRQYRKEFKRARHTSTSSIRKAVWVPVTLIAAGWYATTDNDILYQVEVNEERNEWLPAFKSRIDDYTQYAPAAAVYLLNLAGVKGKNNVINQTALLIKSEVLMTAIVFPLKRISGVPRPDSGQRTSFPSGHTAQAFVAATFLHKEYGHRSMWYSIGGYSVATFIGVMRVLNNRHWASDVLVGAGIGILSVNLVYLTHKFKWGKNRFTGLSLAPVYSTDIKGLSATYTLKARG